MVGKLAYSQADALPPKAGGHDGGEPNTDSAFGVRVLAPNPGTLCAFVCVPLGSGCLHQTLALVLLGSG